MFGFGKKRKQAKEEKERKELERLELERQEEEVFESKEEVSQLEVADENNDVVYENKESEVDAGEKAIETTEETEETIEESIKESNTKEEGMLKTDWELNEESYEVDETVTDDYEKDSYEIEESEENIREEVEEIEEVEEVKKKGFFGKLVDGLTKTRDNLLGGIEDVLSSFKKIDEDFFEELEEALIMADLGVQTSTRIVEDLEQKVKELKISDAIEVKALLKKELEEIMITKETDYDFVDKKTVLLVIGVNGVGKTTTIGKLSNQYKKAGKSVMLAAADTFRAAAIDQLKEWANRSDVPIIAQGENSDPGAVIYDAIQSAKAKDTDILICDTAGRLHNKKNLMNELNKIYRIIEKEYPEAHKEVLLVLDSTTGQNALQQAKLFKETADITGVVLTKLDGTAKGGIAIAIQSDYNIPIKYIGIGEGIDDLRPFHAHDFIEALFDDKNEEEENMYCVES